MPGPMANSACSSTASWSMTAKTTPANWGAKERSSGSCRRGAALSIVPNARNESQMSVVLTEVRGPIGIATLNRPEALNALNTPLLDALADTLEAWDADPAVRVMVVTGSDKAFAAGADIKEMAPKSFAEMHRENIFGGQIDRIARIAKPVIAAVAGFALGGGCELAMALDILLAADTAKF